MAVSRTLKYLDQFRVVTAEYSKGTAAGGFFTAVAYVIIALILVSEFRDFMSTSTQSNMLMDYDHREKLVQINFDILVYDLPCKYAKVHVYDKFGEEKMNTTDAFKFHEVTREGRSRGRIYTAEEVAALEQEEMTVDMTDDEKQEYDSDWSSTSDQFKHNDFKHVITFHDYSLILFYADWCVHCRQFHPTWNKAVAELSEKKQFKDGDGRTKTVKLLKVNCVDFQPLCTENQIMGYPALRLYKRDGKFEPFQKRRSLENITDFVTETVKKSHLITAKHHSIFDSGCRIQGNLKVPRVPGHFHIQAEDHDGQLNLNPALTNVSHMVTHLSFGDLAANAWAITSSIPKDVLDQIAPIDGKRFIVQRFHESPQHQLKVVATRLPGGPIVYQMAHTDRTRRLPREKNLPPQARFTYDFSPLSMVLTEKKKRWYEFLTSVFAIIGGTYTVIELFSGTVVTATNIVKEGLGKNI